jgi:hypothetical protein
MKIPEIRENTLIAGFAVLPTPQRNDTLVVVTFFKGGGRCGTISFIWEVVIKDEKILKSWPKARLPSLPYPLTISRHITRFLTSLKNTM